MNSNNAARVVAAGLHTPQGVSDAMSGLDEHWESIK